MPARPQPAKALVVASGERISSVAKHCELNAATLGRILNGYASPWPALTERLAEHLGVDASDLWLDGQRDALQTLVAALEASR